MDKLMASGKIKGALVIHQGNTPLPPEGICLFIPQIFLMNNYNVPLKIFNLIILIKAKKKIFNLQCFVKVCFFKMNNIKLRVLSRLGFSPDDTCPMDNFGNKYFL